MGFPDPISLSSAISRDYHCLFKKTGKQKKMHILKALPEEQLGFHPLCASFFNCDCLFRILPTYWSSSEAFYFVTLFLFLSPSVNHKSSNYYLPSSHTLFTFSPADNHVMTRLPTRPFYASTTGFILDLFSESSLLVNLSEPKYDFAPKSINWIKSTKLNLGNINTAWKKLNVFTFFFFTFHHFNMWHG